MIQSSKKQYYFEGVSDTEEDIFLEESQEQPNRIEENNIQPRPQVEDLNPIQNEYRQTQMDFQQNQGYYPNFSLLNQSQMQFNRNPYHFDQVKEEYNNHYEIPIQPNMIQNMPRLSFQNEEFRYQLLCENPQNYQRNPIYQFSQSINQITNDHIMQNQHNNEQYSKKLSFNQNYEMDQSGNSENNTSLNSGRNNKSGKDIMKCEIKQRSNSNQYFLSDQNQVVNESNSSNKLNYSQVDFIIEDDNQNGKIKPQKQVKKQISKFQNFQSPRQQSKLKSSKNQIKNFMTGIKLYINYLQMISPNDFKDFTKDVKILQKCSQFKKTTSITALRELLTQNKCFRIIVFKFLREQSFSYFMTGSKIKDIWGSLTFVRPFIKATKNPTEFYSWNE